MNSLKAIIALAVIASGRCVSANSFTWGGSTDVLGDSGAWVGSAPNLGGSATDTLLFQPASGYVATINSAGSWIVNTLDVETLPATIDWSNPVFPVPGTATINGSAGLVFAGNSPSIQFGQEEGLAFAIDAPVTFISDLVMAGIEYPSTLTLSKPLSDAGSHSQLTLINSSLINYQTNVAPTFSGGLVLSMTSAEEFSPRMNWIYTPTTGGAVRLAFGSGPITLDGGTFQMTVAQGSPAVAVEITNAIRVTSNGGYLWGSPSSNGSTVTYSGSILLGGGLATQPTPNALEMGSVLVISGTVTLDQSSPAIPSIVSNVSFLHPADDYLTVLSGNIVDDPSPAPMYHHPISLVGYDEEGHGMLVSGSANTYSTGTLIDGSVTVAANSSLGTGSVTVNSGVLQLTAASNIAPGRRVLLMQYGTLALDYPGDPTVLVDPASQGGLALDTTFTQALNMATLGNGLMSLGSAGQGTYDAASLLPGIDHVYRFASRWPYGSNLIITHSVLADYDGVPSKAQLDGVTLAAANSYTGGSVVSGGPVFATAAGALGSGDVSVGDSDDNRATLSLNTPNAVSANATVTVYGTLIVGGPSGSIPNGAKPPILTPGGILQLGDGLNHNGDTYGDLLPIRLPGATLKVTAVGDTTETVGPITYSGQSSLVVSNAIAATTTLITSALGRDGHGALVIVQDFPQQGAAPSLNVQVTSGLAQTSGMLPAFIQIQSRTIYPAPTSPWLNEPSFATSTASGIAPVAYVDFPANGGTGTEIVGVHETFMFPMNPWTLNAVTLPIDTSIYALRTDSNILNPATGPVALHIVGGGLIVAMQAFSDMTIEPDIDFGSAEAVINTTFPNYGSGTVTLSGKITAQGGLTKMGELRLDLAGTSSAIDGPIVILQGSLNFGTAPVPGADPITIYDDGGMGSLASMTIDRPVHFILSDNGSALARVASGATVGSLQINGGTTLTFAQPVTSTLGLNVGGLFNSGSNGVATLRIKAPVTLGGVYGNGLVIEENTVLQLDSTLTTPGERGVFWGVLTGTGTLRADSGMLFISDSLEVPPVISGISPGDNPGDIGTLSLITSGTVDFDGTLSVDVGQGDADLLRIQGDMNLTLQAAADYAIAPTLALNFMAPLDGEDYVLVSATSIEGTFVVVTGLPDGYVVDYSIPGEIRLISVPEPLSIGILGNGRCWIAGATAIQQGATTITIRIGRSRGRFRSCGTTATCCPG